MVGFPGSSLGEEPRAVRPDASYVEQDLKAAREQSLLGNYDVALERYEAVLGVSAETLAAALPSDERRAAAEKWERCQILIREEVKLLRQIIAEWTDLGPFGAGAAGLDGGAGPKPPPKVDMLDDFFRASMMDEPAQARVGHRPEEDRKPSPTPVWDGVIAPPSPRNEPRQPRQRGGGGGAGGELPGWAQGRDPPPLPARPKRSPPVRAERDAAPHDRGPRGGRGGGGGGAPGRGNAGDGRNYKKPWLDNAPQKAGGKEDKSRKSGDHGSNSYLEHCYGPDGKGPDADLIQMLEKDCVDRAPQVTWDSIAGLEQAKQLLEEAVVLPLVMPEYFQGIRRPWKGVLMFGPPGTGKTMLAKAVATQCETTFFNVSAATMASKYRGDSEKLVRILFEMARFYAPTSIFFDEVDALGGKRGDSSEHEASRRVKAELLVQMDGVTSSAPAQGDDADPDAEPPQPKQVMVLGATNRPWDLDEALRRRLEKRIYIPLPDVAGRTQLFEINLKDVKLGTDVNIPELVRRCDGYSGADVTSVCREAAMMGLRKRMAKARQEGISVAKMQMLKDEVDVPVTQADLLEALKNVQRSVGTEDLQHFSDWMKEFGSV